MDMLVAFKEMFTSRASRKLIWACKNGETAEVRRLLAAGGVNLESTKETITPLQWASSTGRIEICKLLIDAGANVNAMDDNQYTALSAACSNELWAVASLLLEAGANPNSTSTHGTTPLSDACSFNHTDTVQRLLKAGADVNARVKTNSGCDPEIYDLRGWTALYWTRTAATARLLLAAGADFDYTDKAGETPLHEASKQSRYGVVEALLEAGAKMNTTGKDGYCPIHCVLFVMARYGCDEERMKTLQVLVRYGAKWDTTCEEITGQKVVYVQSTMHVRGRAEHAEWAKEAPAIRVCMLRWIQEHGQGIPLMEIPIEDIKNGVEATNYYIIARVASRDIKFRRKICVVGPSNWGKTSLIKSLTTKKPHRVDPDDRTIGIDHFEMFFDEPLPDLKAIKKHEVTFWDFAGQDEYQVAHSLFFSRRTLYLVCIDLKAYAVTFLQALLMTDDNQTMDERMNWYVETRILRWIRLIFVYQPDAEFEFIGTKNDLIWLEPDQDALDDLSMRLANVMVVVAGMKKAVARSDERKLGDRGLPERLPVGYREELEPITRLEDKRLHLLKDKPSPCIIYSSCTKLDAVVAAQDSIKRILLQSQRSYPMPDAFSRLLNAIVERRAVAAGKLTDVRIQEVFVNIDTLIEVLVREVEGISAVACRSILKTLRDLGDVLWYGKLHDDTLRNTVIIDPLLMIDLIRHVVDHNHKGEVIFHATLRALNLWRNLSGAQMLAMKRVLQHFQLVYPTDNEMQEGSDLMMPAFWRTKTSAQWLFLGQELKGGIGARPANWRVRVHWEINIEYGFQEALFDRLVVASYNSAYHREVGPDYIMYEDDEGGLDTMFAVRLVVDWHRETHKRVLHLEAVFAKSASPRMETEVWTRFELLCANLSLVLETLPGLLATASARNDRGGTPALRICTTPASKWLPPEPTLSKCRGLLA